MSSFWLTLKQQWTIRISSPLFLFLAWRTSWLEVGITGHNFERRPSKDHSTTVWLQLVQWFLRRRLKCEMLTDGRRTKSDDNSSHGLKARWANKKLSFNTCMFTYKCILCFNLLSIEMKISWSGPPLPSHGIINV